MFCWNSLHIEDIVMKIVIDHREMRSGVPEALVKLGAEIEVNTLKVGDLCCK